MIVIIFNKRGDPFFDSPYSISELEFKQVEPVLKDHSITVCAKMLKAVLQPLYFRIQKKAILLSEAFKQL